jgi:hypothetical protein
MTESDRVHHYAGTEYVELSTGGATGAAELAGSGRRFGVVTNENGEPTLLLTRDGPAPAVQIHADAPMQRTLSRDVLGLLNSGVPGLVVVRDAGPVGILSADTVSDYAMAHVAVRSGLMGDVELHGDPPVSRLKLTCTTCGTVNTVPFFVEGETRCSQGHLLTVRRA